MLKPPLALRRSETLEEAFRRVLFEQFDVVALALDREPEALGPAVHIARRTLKKIRALLRLIASGEGGAAVGAPLIDLRDAGRALAPVRHADVLVTVVRAAAADLPASHGPQSLASLERLLVAQRDSAFERARDGVALATAVRQTDAARRAVEGWKPCAADFHLIRAGLRDWYSRGRQAMETACGGTNAEVYHEWRKRAKDVRHQVEFLAPIAPDVLVAAADLHRLSDLLGDANDLDHLEAAVRLHNPAEFIAADRVLRFLADKRRSHWSAACSLGRELFAEEPADHASGLESHWGRWVAEASAEVGQG